MPRKRATRRKGPGRPADVRRNPHRQPESTAERFGLSPRSRSELDDAIRYVLRLASGKRRGRLQWPDQYLQQSLTRDGDHPVIDYLSFLATAAMLENQKRYGLTAQEVAISCRDWMLGPFPFSATAWKRATDLVLHRIDNRPIPPADWFDDDIEAVDLAGALLTLHVIALMRLCARQTGPLARAGGHLPPRPPRPPRSL